MVNATLVGREKRFFLHATLNSGEAATAHCPNTGSLAGCLPAGAPVLFTDRQEAAKKLKYVWQAVEVDGCWVGVNTALANTMAQEILLGDALPGLEKSTGLRREVPYGEENSRIDFLLTDPQGKQVYVEVKNVTLRIEDEAQFPDAVTERGQKHLRELMAMVRQGHRAVLLFLVQRDDVAAMAPAEGYDPAYGVLLREAIKSGVEVFAACCGIAGGAVHLRRWLPIRPVSHHPPQKLAKK